jgi:hypothetical protein
MYNCIVHKIVPYCTFIRYNMLLYCMLYCNVILRIVQYVLYGTIFTTNDSEQLEIGTNWYELVRHLVPVPVGTRFTRLVHAGTHLQFNPLQ